MEYWNTILHTALLGTGKGAMQKENMPRDIAESFELISGQQTDQEDQFLQMASVAMNYRKCGLLAAHQPLDFPRADDEDKPYCTHDARQVLDDILHAGNLPLLKLWLALCANANQLIPPERLPSLFDLAMKKQVQQQQLMPCAGKRGEWLLKLNDAWKIDSTDPDEDSWHTGTPDQRMRFLQHLRKTDPLKARELLQQSWPQENANTRAEFLKQLRSTLSSDDVPWLEQLLNEKSQKVREEATRLLKQIPASSVVQQYWDIVGQSVSIQKEKGLLGIGKKTVVNIQLAGAVDERIFKTGIEKMSSRKNVSDADHILCQLIESVPPSFFEERAGLKKEDIIESFSKSDHARQFLPAFGKAAVRFNDKEWIKFITDKFDDEIYPEALYLLDNHDAEKYALRFLLRKETAQMMAGYMVQYFDTEWSKELTKQFLKITAPNFYQYNRGFYADIIMRFPVDIIPELKKYTPSNPYAMETWIKTSELIIHLLTLKVQTLKAFQT